MSKSLRNQIGLTLVAFIWGITFVVVKNNTDSIEPFCFNFIRFSLSALLVFSYILIVRKQGLIGLTYTAFRDGCCLGFCLFWGFASLTLGLVHTTASNAGFITGMNVVMVPLFSAIIRKHKIDLVTVMGVSAAAIGLYFLTFKGSVSINKGDLLIFIGAVAFAFHVIFTETCSQRSSTGILVMIQFCFVGALSGICAYCMEDMSVITDIDLIFSRDMLSVLTVVVFLSTCLALLVQTRAQKTVAPTKVALIFCLEPVFAAMSGHFWAGESLGPSALIGCSFIFLGMIVVNSQEYLKSLVKDTTINARTKASDQI